MAEQSPNTLQPSPAANNYTVDIWEQRWTDNVIGFHEEGGNKMLLKNIEQIMSEHFSDRQPGKLKVFVPLCGKTKDLCLFYKMGCTVVGVEYASKAITDFFEENELKSVTDNHPFTSTSDDRLILGQGDLFSFSDVHQLPWAKYDMIWDRGSFVAINETDRSKYAQFMRSLLNDKGLYIVDVHEYDRAEYGGPPLAVTQQDLSHYFGSDIKLQLLDTRDLTAEGSDQRDKWTSKGLTKMLEKLYIFK